MPTENIEPNDNADQSSANLVTEAIILAGGLGTRLRETVPDLPKCMAPVNGRPFLFYVINYLRSQGIEKFIFSLGYKHEFIESYLQEQFSTLDYETAIEKEPLGTGGAILACSYMVSGKTVAVANGDTLYKVDLGKAFSKHKKHNAACTILLKPMTDFDRYGVVELNDDDSIKNFKEKKHYQQGLINGGMYLLDTEKFIKEDLPEKFSFEKDFLEKQFLYRRMTGSVQDEYFIDIGIPEDFQRVQKELEQPPLELQTINDKWTLFLDRDGVINYEKKDDYIRNWEEFRFYDGVMDAIKIFSEKFGRVFIVSNQRGVGKGLMSEDDVENIHLRLRSEIESNGGKIDGIYYCTAVDPEDPFRKPNPGMAYQAKNDFPDIDLSRSIMVGNKPSDMLFGKNSGMYTIYLATTHPETPFPHQDIDLRFNSLSEFTKAL